VKVESSILSEFTDLMSAQLAGEELTPEEGRRLSDLLSSDGSFVRLAVEMAVANEACATLLAKLAV
jgi:site-specific recombinase